VLCQPDRFALKRWTQRYLRTSDARFMSSLRILLVLSAVAAALAGCGVRGPLEPPPGAAAPDPYEPAAVDPLIKPE
jgi:predicted small lipoprotein YifL